MVIGQKAWQREGIPARDWLIGMNEIVRQYVVKLVESIFNQIQKSHAPLIVSVAANKKARLSFNKPCHLRRIAGILRILELMMTKGEGTMTKRDVYYMDTQLFGNQLSVDSTLNILATSFGVPRDALGIVSAPKGLAFGDLIIDEEGSILDFGHRPVFAKTSGAIIMLHTPQIVLIVEKEAVFNTLCQLYPTLRQHLPSLLLITGRGYPCMSSLRFVNLLSRNTNARILALVDYDPYGLNIALQYYCGSKLIADRESTCCPNLEFLGVTLKDLDYFSDQLIPDKSRSRLNTRGSKILKMVMAKADHTGWTSVVQAAEDMEAAGFCTEIESIYQHDSTRLLSYIISKINGASLKTTL
jgi:DNA topoisomerase VI subunit A